MSSIVEKLQRDRNLTNDEFKRLVETDTYDKELFETACRIREQYYSKEVYLRGLIEFSNYCKNNCYYCGIRHDNVSVARYRLDKKEILACCEQGYELGFRTFVLQSGEDPFYTDEVICEIVGEINKNHPDCAITLSMGEKSYDSYKKYYEAGATRYLLRHEAANSQYYAKLHPENMKLESRKECLWNLKKIGYQVGCGFMVGAPYQTTEDLIEDLKFLREFKPDMVGIGPYIVHQDTPFHNFSSGSLELSLRLVAIARIMLPSALIPATTALGTIDAQGRELGLKAGANVVMPNLTPVRVRKLYSLYDNKICTGEEAAECRGCLERRVSGIGYEIVVDIGNVKRVDSL